MKKTIYFFISILVVVLISFFICEILLKAIPIVCRNIPSNKNIQYIYILGESTCVGFPYHKISYSKILEYSIRNQKINNKKIEIINLAESGWQLYHQYIYYVIYRYTHPFNKGIMLLYMGTNNWANKSLYTDFERNLYLMSNVYQLFDKYLRLTKLRTEQAYRYLFDFEYEYEKIVLLAKRFGEDIYMSTISGNYEFPPDTDDMVTDFRSTKLDELYFNSQIEEAKLLCEELLELQGLGTKAQLWYRMGKILEKEGNIKEANDAFIKAHQYGFENSPEPIFQNNIIKKIAKKYNIPVFDFFDMLYNSGEIIGFDFFIDTVHPNIKTHIDIAYGFIDLLSKNYQFDYIDKKNLDVEKLKEYLGFTNNDLARVIMSRIMELRIYRGEGFKFNENVYNIWVNQLEQLKLDEAILPNTKYINAFLKFEEKYREAIDSRDERKKNKLKERLDIYGEETFSGIFNNN